MRFELRSRENVEALAPDIQRVDLRWILFSVIGKDLDVGASLDFGVRIVFGLRPERDCWVAGEIGSCWLDVEVTAAVRAPFTVLVVGSRFDLDSRLSVLEIPWRPDRPDAADAVQGGSDQPFST
jgi:hypothetical protein